MWENGTHVEMCCAQERKQFKRCHVTQYLLVVERHRAPVNEDKTAARWWIGTNRIIISLQAACCVKLAPADGDMEQLLGKNMQLLRHLSTSQTWAELNTRRKAQFQTAGLYSTGGADLLRAPYSDYLSWLVPNAQTAVTSKCLQSKKVTVFLYAVFCDIRKSTAF